MKTAHAEYAARSSMNLNLEILLTKIYILSIQYDIVCECEQLCSAVLTEPGLV
jgi:hypothetical protein